VTAPDQPTVVCLGEVLIDLIAADGKQPLERSSTFHMAPGGAPANVAVALARLGTTVAFIGKVADDAFGRVLCETLAREQVDVRALATAPGARTALAFVGSDGNAGRRFVFYHDRTADTQLEAHELDRAVVERARIFHFGSVTLSAEPSRTATLAAARWAQDCGRMVSFDPNVRLEVWPSEQLARETILEAMRLADVVKVSSDELEFLTGTSNVRNACRRLRARGPSLAVVTEGEGGSFYQTARSSGHIAGIRVDVVDTLGAGDAFMAGLLACLAGVPASSLADESALPSALRFANAVGAITTTGYGAIPALPKRVQVEALLRAESPAV
jgi:fructokinase